MGQKVNPHGMRVGINAGWEATWYADKKDFAAFIKEDDVVRKYIKKTYYSSAISKISFERSEGKLVVNVFTGRPGTLIGKQGAGIEEMKKGSAADLTVRKSHVESNITKVVFLFTRSAPTSTMATLLLTPPMA